MFYINICVLPKHSGYKIYTQEAKQKGSNLMCSIYPALALWKNYKFLASAVIKRNLYGKLMQL